MRELLIPKKACKTDLLFGFLVVALSLLLVASLTGNALARGTMQAKEDIVKGEVVSMDNSHKTPTITVNEANTLSNINPSNELNVFLNNKTNVMICMAHKPLKDIKVGDKVAVSYHELAGLAVADRISKAC